MKESVDRRALGAFRCIDSITGSAAVEPMATSSTQLAVRPNHSGIYVIFNGPGLSALTTQFSPPTAATWANPSPFEIIIQDPRRRYLPRRVQLQAPQPLGVPSDAASFFNPQSVTLYPNGAAPILPNWAVVRVSVVRTGTPPPNGLPWAVTRVTRTSDNTVLATGMADSQGEALMAVAGMGAQVSKNAAGAVTDVTVGVSVDAWFDTDIQKQPVGWIPNPDDVLNNLAKATVKHSSANAQIAAGQAVSLSIAISV